MAVPEPIRNQGQLTVNTKAQELCAYTLKITANEKHFPKTQDEFIQRIRGAAVDIHCLCWEANNIKVCNSPERYKTRLALQAQAADKCNRLCALIEVAKPLFHLSNKRTVYWLHRTIEVRNLIRAWHEADTKRLRPHDVGM